MRILSIDPGPEKSSFVGWSRDTIVTLGERENIEMFKVMRELVDADGLCEWGLSIEMVASYGMAVGKEVFETCVWIGRFDQYWSGLGNRCASLVYRKDVKMHLCQSMRAKDANIRQALIDRFGKPGTKKNPGRLYGVSNHIWSALAIAVTTADTTKPL